MDGPLFGPATCHECHAPGLYLFANPARWLERNFVRQRKRAPDLTVRFDAHRCTARSPIVVGGLIR